MNRASKPNKIFPVLSINKLAFLLGQKVKQLRTVSRSAGVFYEPFDRLQIKKTGRKKWRHIDNPTGDLKKIQQKINHGLLRGVMGSMPKGMMGGISGKSIITNAAAHQRQELVITLDLRDCFPETDNRKVFRVWKNYLGCGNEVSNLLTKLTTFQRRLPQGSPTSLAICNLTLLPLFNDIEKYCSTVGLNFTLYVDDITISGKNKPCIEAIKPLIFLIQKNGYAIRRSKIKIMPSGTRQQVTGIVVNKKVSLGANFKEIARKEIIDLSRHENVSRKDFQKMWGKIQYIKTVSHDQGEKLENFALAILPSTLECFEGGKNEITRKCKCTQRHKYD